MSIVEHRACASAEIAEGGMKAVELAHHTVLLARVEAGLHAIVGVCPHAGAPLVQGVLRGDTVICPWHKAAFCVRTGGRREPPAVDDLAQFAVREVDGTVLVALPDEVPARVDPAVVDHRTDERCFVIVGAGAAGAMAAQALREEGFAGRVVMVGREELLPYDRTLLSKYVLSGKQGGEKSPLQSEQFYSRHRIERLVRKVVSVDPSSKRVMFDDGTLQDYDAALVATGGGPRVLPVPGAELANIFLLRTAAHASAIVTAATTARHAVVVGAGFIGMEAAASLRERGLAVTVVGPEQAPFEKQLGGEIGNAFRRLHEQQGVQFRLGRQVRSYAGESAVREVLLDDGQPLPADLVVVGMGIRPIAGLLQGVERRPDGGVNVDARLRWAEETYAAGDIAAFPLRGDGEPIRVEHWRVAQQHGRVAALNMMGQPTVYDAVPYFWTIQYMKRLDYVGHASTWDEAVIDGDLNKPEFLAFYVKHGRVAAVAGWDRDRQMAAVIGLMTDQRDWTIDALRQALGVGW